MSVIWLVEWDLKGKGYPRTRFYRELGRLLAGFDCMAERTTQSVLKTDSEQLARQIHALACGYGKAHIYRAEQIE